MGVSAAQVITKKFTSAAQAIVSAGAITIAHGLGGVPEMVEYELTCASGEAGYLLGAFLPLMEVPEGTGNRGVNVTADAANLYVRFGSDVNAFATLHNTSGAGTVLTNSSWTIKFKAYI